MMNVFILGHCIYAQACNTDFLGKERFIQNGWNAVLSFFRSRIHSQERFHWANNKHWTQIIDKRIISNLLEFIVLSDVQWSTWQACNLGSVHQVPTGSVKCKVCPTLLPTTSSGTWTSDLFILSLTSYLLSYVLPRPQGVKNGYGGQQWGTIYVFPPVYYPSQRLWEL